MLQRRLEQVLGQLLVASEQETGPQQRMTASRDEVAELAVIQGVHSSSDTR
jgi:hypothetical protein